MPTRKETYIDVKIDKLTNSIENIVSGDSFPTEISILQQSDINTVTKKSYWLFNWKNEFELPDRDVYKLTIEKNQTVIQGLISLSVMSDHVFVHLIENAPFNTGKSKVYAGVAGNLFAFACRLSFQRGCGGFVSFRSKNKLIDHYITSLGAYHLGGNVMIIDNNAALKLINKYFPA